MSLNGLEATEVIDAYQAALGEGGGWFLLKYISRDEVALLGKGNGGLAELKEAVNRYEEQSPLYGFINYRRRKVILKYIPEGTSRVLQARVTVQFDAVREQLSPYDTIFPFTQSADLKDSALSSACSLHTATASLKSSSDSLPQRGLAEIAEDASESRIDTAKGGVPSSGITREEGRPPDAEHSESGPEKVNGSTSADGTHHRSTSLTTQSFSRPRTTSNTDKPLPPPPGDPSREDTSSGSILDHRDHSTRPSMDGRFSSNSTRPSTRDLYDAYGYKKKAKIGPRPSTDSTGAQQSPESGANEFRPVSTLPAGLRMPSRKAVPTRPASRQAQTDPPSRTSSTVTASPPAQANSPERMIADRAPTAPVAPIHMSDRNPPTPNHVLKPPRMPEPGPLKMTPEKQRLMKALQLRQKQIAARNHVNGLGIENVSEGPGLSKSDIDDSIISAVIDASDSAEGPEPVQVTAKDVAKEDSRHLEDSPISMPETAEESSTNASSITDEEEIMAHKRYEMDPKLGRTISRNEDLLSKGLVEDGPSNLNGSQDVATEGTRQAVVMKIGSVERLRAPSRSPTRIQSHTALRATDAAEQTTVGKIIPKSVQYEQSTVIGKSPLNEVDSITAEKVVEDAPLSPILLRGDQAAKDQSTANTEPPLLHSRVSLPAEADENIDLLQTEPFEVPEEASYKGELSKNEETSQSQPLGQGRRVQSTPITDDSAPVLQDQSKEGRRRSPERQVRSPDESIIREAQNNAVKPLLVRRSSSSKSIIVHSDSVNAHEIPLPPIDEDEKISLSPQRASFREQTAMYHVVVTDDGSKRATPQAKLLSQNSDHSIARPSTANSGDLRQIERQAEMQVWKQGVANPSKRAPSPDQSDEHFLSDDSFMEELKSATVQEAKPVSVSKSPIKPVFSRSESEQRLSGVVRDFRSVSSPVGRSAKGEEMFSSPRLPTPPSTSRSLSAQHAPCPGSQQSQVPMPKKIGVSSNISQRIKALEQLSSRPSSPVSPNSASNKSAFLGIRKTSLRAPSGVSDDKNSNLPVAHPGAAYPSPSPSPETVRSTLGNQPNRAAYLHQPKMVNTMASHDGSDHLPALTSNPSELRRLNTQESLLQGMREKSQPPAEPKAMGPPPLSPLKPPRPRFGRYASTRSGSSSSNEQKLEPSPTTRRDSFASIRSKSSRAGSEVELPRTLSDSSLSGVASLDGSQDEKKDSRRSRLLKRMSSISSMSRRSIAHALSPGPKEAPIIERQEPVQEAPSTSVDVGDVNVQFPDTLLWKRRQMVIDAQGILVLSASKSDNNSKVVTKRYPLSDFLPPYIPDQDRQELPNSVVLDFKNGSTLQCACEHLQGQAGVLKALRHAHSVHQAQ